MLSTKLRRNMLLPLILVLMLLILSPSLAQDEPPSLIVYRDEYSLTVYVRTAEALALIPDLAILARVDGEDERLDLSELVDSIADFPDSVDLPTCFRLELFGIEQIMPSICPPASIYERKVLRSEMIWFDNIDKTIRSILIAYDPGEIREPCTNTRTECPIPIELGLIPVIPGPDITPDVTVITQPITATANGNSNLRIGPGREYLTRDSVFSDERIAICGQQTARFDPSEIWLALCEDKGWILAARVTLQEPATIASLPNLPAPPLSGDCSTVQITYATGGSSSTSGKVYWYPYHCPMIVTVNPMGTGTVVAGSQDAKVTAPYTVSPGPAGNYEIKIWDGTSDLPEDLVPVTVQ